MHSIKAKAVNLRALAPELWVSNELPIQVNIFFIMTAWLWVDRVIGYWGVYSYVFTTPYFGGVVFFHAAKPLLQADDVFLWGVFAHFFFVTGDG